MEEAKGSPRLKKHTNGYSIRRSPCSLLPFLRQTMGVGNRRAKADVLVEGGEVSDKLLLLLLLLWHARATAIKGPERDLMQHRSGMEV